MPLPNKEDCLNYIRACMELDHLRVLKHQAEERLDMVTQSRQIHVRPTVAVAAAVQASPQGPAAHKRQAAVRKSETAGAATSPANRSGRGDK